MLTMNSKIKVKKVQCTTERQEKTHNIANRTKKTKSNFKCDIVTAIFYTHNNCCILLGLDDKCKIIESWCDRKNVVTQIKCNVIPQDKFYDKFINMKTKKLYVNNDELSIMKLQTIDKSILALYTTSLDELLCKLNCDKDNSEKLFKIPTYHDIRTMDPNITYKEYRNIYILY